MDRIDLTLVRLVLVMKNDTPIFMIHGVNVYRQFLGIDVELHVV